MNSRVFHSERFQTLSSVSCVTGLHGSSCRDFWHRQPAIHVSLHMPCLISRRACKEVVVQRALPFDLLKQPQPCRSSCSDGNLWVHMAQVVAYDFGIKHNILRRLAAQGCKLTVVPADYPAEKVLAMNPDGIFLSNGPVRRLTCC